MKVIYTLVVLGFVSILTSCSNKVDFGEQYKKVVYIVNSKEALHYAQHEASSTSKGNISIYVTGSELPDNDIHISYKVDEDALNKYNEKEFGTSTQKFFYLVPKGAYSFETSDVTILKGESYGCLNFTINTTMLLPDKVYILPIKIEHADNAEISENLHTILYVIQIQNKYAGDYISSYSISGSAKGEFSKKVIAISGKKVLLPLTDKSNSSSNNNLSYDTDYYQIMINDDNSLVLESYLNSIIHQNMEKQSYYDPEERIFYIYYNIEDKYGSYLPVQEELKAI